MSDVRQLPLLRMLVPQCGSIALIFLIGCGEVTAPGEENKRPEFMAPITFVVTGIEPEIERVDIVVNGTGIDPVLGSFMTGVTDRVTMQIPAGDSLNAFARAFEVDTIISFIGESYFHVRNRSPQEVIVPLKFKGPHSPTF